MLYYFYELWHRVQPFGWQRIITVGPDREFPAHAESSWDTWLEDWRETFVGPGDYFARQFVWTGSRWNVAAAEWL